LHAELGAISIQLQKERQNQACQIARLESALSAGQRTDKYSDDGVDEAVAELERWLSGNHGHHEQVCEGPNQSSREQALESQGRCAAACISRSQSQPALGQSSGRCSRPPTQSSANAGQANVTAGPLPPPLYWGPDSTSGASKQQPSFSSGIGVNRHPNVGSICNAGFQTADQMSPFSHFLESGLGSRNMKFDPLTAPATAPAYGLANFNAILGSSFGPSFGARLGEVSSVAPSMWPMPWPDALHSFGLDGRPTGARNIERITIPHRESPQVQADNRDGLSPLTECEEVLDIPSVPPPARSPGLPPEACPEHPMLPHGFTPRLHPGLEAAVAGDAQLEMKLTEANLREAIDDIGFESRPASTRCTSVANFGEVVGFSEQPTPVCLSGRSNFGAPPCLSSRSNFGEGSALVGNLATARSVGGDSDARSKATCPSGTGLDEDVAKKLYQRFGLGSCMTFEKFVRLHETHLPSEKPSVRPATGGA
jgi:hypothetical protein